MALKGDLKFLAGRQRLSIPIVPVRTLEERQLVTQFIQQYGGRATAATFIAMAVHFKERADGRTIFHKLPCILKAYHSQWVKNQSIKALERKIQQPLNMLLRSLADPIPAPPPVAVSPQPAPLLVGAAVTFVPPPNAPSATFEAPSSSSRTSRPCAWSPFCDKMAYECGGWMQAGCACTDCTA